MALDFPGTAGCRAAFHQRRWAQLYLERDALEAVIGVAGDPEFRHHCGTDGWPDCRTPITVQAFSLDRH